MSPAAARMSGVIVTGAGLADFADFADAEELGAPSTSGISRMPVSAKAEMRPIFTISYSIRNLFLKPRSFGMRIWIGVCPPSNHGWMVPPVLDFWPLVPRPAVLPLPAAMPRPTRVRGLRLPSACLLYTSDAADDLLCVDLGGRR